MRTIWSTLWQRKASLSAQMANETNLCAEESWVERTRNGGGSGWCGSAFSKFLVQISCCVSSDFTDFCSTFDNFKPLVSVLQQIFLAIRSDTERLLGDLQCIFEACFLAFLGVLALRQFAIEHFLSCGQHDEPNKAVIASRWCRYREKKLKLKSLVSGMCFCHVVPKIFLRQVLWKWFSSFICHW